MYISTTRKREDLQREKRRFTKRKEKKRFEEELRMENLCKSLKSVLSVSINSETIK